MKFQNCQENSTKKQEKMKQPAHQTKPLDKIERMRFCGRERMKRYRERKKKEGTYAEYLEKQRKYRQRALDKKNDGLESEVQKKRNLRREREIHRKEREAQKSQYPYLDSPAELPRDIARVKKVLPKNREKAVILLKLLINDYEKELMEEKVQKKDLDQIEIQSCQSSLEEELIIKEEIVIKEEIINDYQN